MFLDNVVVFIIDMVHHRMTKEDHERHLRLVLETLGRNKVCAKLKNVFFLAFISTFLGHVCAHARCEGYCLSFEEIENA
jgi:hypothetical protein